MRQLAQGNIRSPSANAESANPRPEAEALPGGRLLVMPSHSGPTQANEPRDLPDMHRRGGRKARPLRKVLYSYVRAASRRKFGRVDIKLISFGRVSGRE